MNRTSIASLILTWIALSLAACSEGASSSDAGSDAGTDAGSNAPAKSWIDVHGAGAQRSDPKEGNPADFPEGRGPQGDAIRIYNFVRLVRGDSSASNSYPVIDTGQTRYFDNMSEIDAPIAGAAFYGQDAHYAGLQSSYTDNGDGTITDNNTGLMWIKECGAKMTYADAAAGAASCRVGGYSDWRLPSIKELYSLMSFAGADPEVADKTKRVPFIDTNFFTFEYGPDTSDTHINDRLIDAQYASATECVSDRDLMKRAFGLNLADGRIKAYPQETVTLPQENWDMTFFVKYVRAGNGSYGKNAFSDNNDGTIADTATGLVWDKDDSGQGLNWQEALAWVQARNAENYKGHADWRLPNAKELQSIVDYTRSPSTTSSPALDPIFNTSTITDEAGGADYPYFWTGTTHQGMNASYAFTGEAAVYIAFGKAPGYFSIDSLNGDSAGSGGPTSCSIQADCDAAAACPSSLGCTCADTPSGKACVPKCSPSQDCPQPPGRTLVCGPDNLCAPSGP